MVKPTKERKQFSTRRYVFAGYATIFVVFGVIGTWAATAPLASAVVAGGIVSVETNRKTIQHLEGGIISQIKVREGDVVEAGEELIELEPTQALGNFTVVKTRLRVLQATEARLIAESTDADEVVFPEALLDTNDPAIDATLKLQNTLFKDRKSTKDNEIAILRVRIEQLNGTIHGLQEQLQATNSQISSIEEEVARLTEGSSSGAVSTNRVAQVTREKLQYESSRGALMAEIAKTRQVISETELQIVRSHQQYVERASSELRDINDQLNESSERFRVAKDVLDRLVVRSPVRGIVQNMRVHTIDGVVRAGEPLLDVIPLEDKLVVIAQINPIDIDNIAVGLVAEVRFPAFSSKTTPTVFGNVMVVSKDIVEPTQQGQQAHYEARIEVKEKNIPLEIRGRLIPGMPAEVIVPTGERTFAEYLIKPLTDSFHKSLREK
ncbi:MAG: HlyD family type I secretion periplasmic adaptor subunit [Hoeflea sp.]|nr:HlyD family type I secretion periplasmic adaptor subunit [Hoeflea sp.]